MATTSPTGRGFSPVATKNRMQPKEKASELGCMKVPFVWKTSGAIHWMVPPMGEACRVTMRESPKSASFPCTPKRVVLINTF